MPSVQYRAPQGTIHLSESPIVFSFQGANFSGNGIEVKARAIIITITNGSSLVCRREVPCGTSWFDIDLSSAIHGWFVGKRYDCTSLESLQRSIQPETFTIRVGYTYRYNQYGSSRLAVEDDAIGGDITIRALEGGLTDYAIYNKGAKSRDDFADGAYSLKPASMETVNYEEQPYPNTGRKYYAEEFYNRLRHRMYFINSCGILESASLISRKDSGMKYSTNVHKLGKSPSFSYTPIVATSKTSSTTINLSSGYCTREWAEWWAQEFAFAKRFWIETEQGLQPAQVSIDSAQVYDNSKGELPHVDFIVARYANSNL